MTEAEAREEFGIKALGEWTAIRTFLIRAAIVSDSAELPAVS